MQQRLNASKGLSAKERADFEADVKATRDAAEPETGLRPAGGPKKSQSGPDAPDRTGANGRDDRILEPLPGDDPELRACRDPGAECGALSTGSAARARFGTGGPLKPGFGLSGAVLLLDKVFPPLVRRFRAVHSDSISTDPHSRVTSHHQVPPLRRSSLLAVICSGRDDRVGRSEHPHSSQNRARIDWIRAKARLNPVVLV